MSGATFGSYRILRQIGEGGMGAVYAAEHVLLGRPAAVKVLLPEHSANQRIVTRFFNEARAATSIRHGGIVEIYDFGYTPDGSAYIAMELLDGESLAARIGRGTLAVASALAITRQIAGALAAAHGAGIVHRDLKPDNVFVVPDAEVPGGERIKLLDFGIAKLMQADPQHAKTNTGTVMGTPAYMAPEQCRGVAVDHRVDLYALGCILFQMLTGRPPFVGEGAGDVLAAHIHVPPPLVRSLAPMVPFDVEALVARLLTKDPAKRPASASELIAEMDRLGPVGLDTGGPGRLTSPPGSSPQVAAAMTTLSSATGASLSVARRGVGMWIGVGTAAVVIVAAVIAMSSGSAREPRAAAAAGSATRAPADAGAAATPAIDARSPTEPTAVGLPTPPPAPVSVPVSIDSEPTGARVVIDGKDVGATPYRGELPIAAAYRILIHHDGYVDETLAIDGSTPIVETVTLARKRKRVGPLDPNKSVNPFGD